MPDQYTVVFAPEAKADLRAIARRIAIQSGYRSRAHDFVERLADDAKALDHTPHRGSLRPDIGPQMRSLGYRRQVTIVFRVLDDEKLVRVVGFFASGLDILALMENRLELPIGGSG